MATFTSAILPSTIYRIDVVSQPSSFNIGLDAQKLSKEISVVIILNNGTIYDAITLEQYSIIAHNDNLADATMSGNGVNNYPMYQASGSYFRDAEQNVNVSFRLYYQYNNTPYDFDLNVVIDSMQSPTIIESIEQITLYENNVADTLYQALENTHIRIKYQGITGKTDISLFAFLDNCRSHSEHTNGNFNMQPNTTIYDYVNDEDIGSSTYNEYGRYDLENLIVKKIQTPQNNGYLGLTFDIEYLSGANTWTDREFEIKVIFNGIKQVVITPKNEYVSKSTTFNDELFNLSAIDGHNNTIGLSPTFQKTWSMVDENTGVVVNYGNVINTNGFKNVSMSITQSRAITTIGTTQIRAYNTTMVGIIATPNKNKYFVHQEIQNYDVLVQAMYLVYGTTYYYKRLHNFGISPKKLTQVGQTIPITISYSNLTATYNVSVLAQEQDKVNIYDKITLAKSFFGEIQNDYNMNFVLDETKDTCEIQVLNFSANELLPYTIVQLESTDTYWCCKSDNVVRYNNEIGSMYKHTIKLVGAIEILNARDLTNCGFNTKTYTINQMLTRLARMINFEMPLFFDLGNIIAGNNLVNYIKTFENYTPLSAIKEIFNGYNCTPKMRFGFTNNGTIESATIYPISKSGNSETPLDISYFDACSEQTSISSESFGTRVISNVQNCVNGEATRYPSVGCTRFIGSSGKVTYDKLSDAYIQLPNNIYHLNSLSFYVPTIVTHYYNGNVNDSIRISADDISFGYVDYKKSLEEKLADNNVTQPEIDAFLNNFGNDIKPKIDEFAIKTLRNGGYYDLTDDSYNGDYAVLDNRNVDITHKKIYVYLNDENYYQTTDKAYNYTIYWQQGKNFIKDFSCLAKAQGNLTKIPTRFVRDDDSSLPTLYQIYTHTFNNGFTLTIKLQPKVYNIYALDRQNDNDQLAFSVDYIPMHDIKMKVENDKDYNDTKLYNQNGKMVDSYAVSKLVNSYASSVSSNEITRSRTLYNFFDIPSVGTKVRYNNDMYVINNVSIDFVMNDNLHYCIPCDFTLTKYVACKSTLISANTNIRDYDCPQQNNIVRTQCYRDYIELDYTLNSQGASYIDFSKVINLSTTSIGVKCNYSTFVKSTDNEFVNTQDNNSHNYYYHISSTKYNLGKQIMIISDFVDNNIIGYGNTRASKPFQFKELFDLNQMITYPISYVNSVGHTTGLEVIYVEDDLAIENFGNYKISKCCAITPTIYNANYSDKIALISETNYDKDGLEIPTFQYSLEIGNTNNILVSDNFFEYEEGTFQYVVIVGDTITNENASLMISELTNYNATLSYTQATRKLTITFANAMATSVKNKNVGVYAKQGNNYRFLFALNNCKYDSTTKIELFVNNYKLK